MHALSWNFPEDSRARLCADLHQNLLKAWAQPVWVRYIFVNLGVNPNEMLSINNILFEKGQLGGYFMAKLKHKLQLHELGCAEDNLEASTHNFGHFLMVPDFTDFASKFVILSKLI